MKKLVLLYTVLITFSAFSQEKDTSNWRVIPSLTDWIEEINNWPETIYDVENIKILIDLKKDSLLIDPLSNRTTQPTKIAATIEKAVRVNHWVIDNAVGSSTSQALHNIHFKERVVLSDYQGLGFLFKNMIFDKRFSIADQNRYSYLSISDSTFKDYFGFWDINEESLFFIRNCEVQNNISFLRTRGNPVVIIEDCNVKNQISLSSQIRDLTIKSTKAEAIYLESTNVSTAASLYDNKFEYLSIAGAVLPENNTYIPFNEVSTKLIIRDFITENNSPKQLIYKADKNEDFKQIKKYNLLIASYKSLLNTYQRSGDQDSYNACYIEIKNIETRRLAYLHKRNPTFQSYFTWKINQFLKVFSAYGTEPARAVVFSMYVILLFALIYLFFPNSWDKHGRNRIMNRYRFFTKYMNQEAGIHEVYLEDQKEELLESEDFKNYMLKAEKTIPKFFMATAMPLYKWSVSGTKFSSSILKRLDIMKGTWSDLPQHKRVWKSILLVGAFLIAIIYDIAIKMLNALMLSINTFTTLGFGEIPIKGLPRYLAIIQGFIGWFMLTIFSVSLISQLLN